MADFNESVAIVLENEGGFVNDPDDTPTNFGVTQAVYSTFLGRPATVSDVQAMPRDVAVKIYRQYWNGIRGEDIRSQYVADALMDMCVLRGISAASKSMQRLFDLKQDGIIGPKSLEAINRWTSDSKGEHALVLGFVDECIVRFVAIVQANPVKLKFLMNWVKRAQRLT